MNGHWKLNIEGRNLLLLQDWIREHRCNWMRVVEGNSANYDPPAPKVGEVPPPFITSIKVTDITKQERGEE